MSLFVVAIAFAPTTVLGQSKHIGKGGDGQNEPPKAEEKERAIQFCGKLARFDKSAKTITVAEGTFDKSTKAITVAERTFQITSETRITKAKGGIKPATLDDAVVAVGVGVLGRYKQAEDGKRLVVEVYFGRYFSF